MADKRTALITGSYGGLGTCLAAIHAQAGGDLVLVGRNTERLEEQKTVLEREHGIHAHCIEADLAREDSATRVHDECARNAWHVDYLINNAGFGGQGDFARERSMSQDMAMIAVNVEAPTRLCKLFLADFVQRRSGRVLNVSSTAALMPGPLQACYYATKAYLTSLSNALWRELKGTGVTVTCLMPGAMRTGFASAGGLSDTSLFANAVDPMPIARAGYEGMLRGKLNVVAGLPGWQKPMMALAPILPKKAMLNFVYDMQVPEGTKEDARA